MVAVYIVSSVFVACSFTFELRLQTYVVLAEVITNWTGIALVIAEVGVSIWVLKIFQQKKVR